jgi:hypothetical protein
MANDSFNELNQRLIAMQQAAMGASNKPGFLFGVIPLEANVGAGLSTTVCGIGTRPILQFPGTGRPGSLADKFLQAVQAAGDDIRQRAQQAGVIYSGNVLNDNVTSGLIPATPRGARDGGGQELA